VIPISTNHDLALLRLCYIAVLYKCAKIYNIMYTVTLPMTVFEHLADSAAEVVVLPGIKYIARLLLLSVSSLLL